MKTFKTKIIIIATILGVFLAACGSDSGTGSEIGQAETVYGLGECEAVNEGVIKLVTSENQYYKCVNGDWEVTEASVQSSSLKNFPFAGSSSSNKAFPGLDTESSTSFGFLSMDSKSEYDSVKQTLKDLRDGQTYRTVKIGNQVWMAENLNYRYLGQTAKEDSSSFCNKDELDSCFKYGRLYLWSAAMDSAGIIEGNTANGCGYLSKCTLSGTVRGICPQGWHVPSIEEWMELIVFVDGSITEFVENNLAGSKLKSTDGWKISSKKNGKSVITIDGNGTDIYSFSVLPVGTRDSYYGSPSYSGKSASAKFWSSTEIGNNNAAYVMGLYYEKASANRYIDEKSEGCSVRCIKD